MRMMSTRRVGAPNSFGLEIPKTATQNDSHWKKKIFFLDFLEVVSSHKKWFGDDDDENKADNNSLGSAAAMQALKMFCRPRFQGGGAEKPEFECFCGHCHVWSEQGA